MKILGIDSGVSCGVAFYDEGKLEGLFTLSPLNLVRYLDINLGYVGLVVIEDSRLTSKLFTAKGQNQASALKIARNVGEVDGICKLVQAICEERKKPLVQVSPKDKGAKVNAEAFKAITGWHGQTNSHERDGAMVAWRFRHLKNVENFTK